MLLHNLSSIVDGYAADHEKSVSHENVNPNTTASGNAIFTSKDIIFGRFLKWMLSKIIYIFAMVQFLAI